eukprot:scaffold30055_cov118-Isochrysis_galbana.AAC.4
MCRQLVPTDKTLPALLDYVTTHSALDPMCVAAQPPAASGTPKPELTLHAACSGQAAGRHGTRRRRRAGAQGASSHRKCGTLVGKIVSRISQRSCSHLAWSSTSDGELVQRGRRVCGDGTHLRVVQGTHCDIGFFCPDALVIKCN